MNIFSSKKERLACKQCNKIPHEPVYLPCFCTVCYVHLRDNSPTEIITCVSCDEEFYVGDIVAKVNTHAKCMVATDEHLSVTEKGLKHEILALLNLYESFFIQIRETISKANLMTDEKFSRSRFLNYDKVRNSLHGEFLHVVLDVDRIQQLKELVESQLEEIQGKLSELNEITKNIEMSRLTPTKGQKTLMTRGSNNLVQLWDLETFTCVNVWLARRPVFTNCIEIMDEKRLVSGLNDSTIKVWDTQEYRCLRTLKGHTKQGGKGISCLIRVAKEKVASWASSEIRVWNIDTGVCIRTIPTNLTWTSCFAYLSKGVLASGSYDKFVHIWDLNTGLSKNVFYGHKAAVKCLIKLENGRLASGSKDFNIKIWDFQCGECLLTLYGHKSTVARMQVTGQGELISCSHDSTIKIWDLDKEQCIRTLHGHQELINCIQVYAERWLISGSRDNTMRVWDLDTGECVKTICCQSYDIRDLIFVCKI